MATDTTKADAIRAMREDGLPEKFNRIEPNAKAAAETEAKSPKVKAAAKANHDGTAKKPAAQRKEPMVVIKAEPKPKRQKPAKADGARKGNVVAKAKPAKSANKTHEGNGGTKLELIGKLLRQPQGCLAADVLSATGWSKVGMNDVAKRLGIKLTKEKHGRVIRYHAE